jgi:hypothetical protein
MDVDDMEAMNDGQSHASQIMGAEEVDVFDGYSFKGRHSVPIDDEDEEEGDILKDSFVDDEKNIPTYPNTIDPATARRPPVRMNPRDGPWNVSVAETPGDYHSYSLYIKSEFLLVYRATESNYNQHPPRI